MMGRRSRGVIVGVALAGVLALGACGGPSPGAAPPPPTSSAPAPPPEPPLAGGPPEAPPPPAPPLFFKMAPIPNPEDLPPGERVRIYGHRYDYLDHPGHRARHEHGRPRPHARHRVHGRIYLGPAPSAPAKPAHRHGRAPHHAAPPSARAAKPAAKKPPRPAAPPASPPPSPGPSPRAPSSSPPAASAPPPAAPTPAAAGSAPPNALNADWLTIPGAPMLNIPGFGKVPSKTVVAVFLLILALAILILAVRGAPGPRKPPPRAGSDRSKSP
jgi:hypothetical protein